MVRTALLLSLLLCPPLSAQEPQEEGPPPAPDRITLANGDVLTGKVVSMADGVIVFRSDPLGKLEIPLREVRDLQTAEEVVLLTTGGETIKRRITGLRGDALQLAPGAEGGPAAPTLDLAQIDRINPAVPQVKWTGTLNIGASASTGNTERLAASTALEMIRRSADDRITADASWIYAEEKTAGVRNLTERRTEGGLKYDYFLSKRSYLLATTRAVGDTKADLDLRYTAGAGYGYQWVEREDLSLSTELGLNYFYENYRTPGLVSDDYVTLRAAYRFKWGITDDLRFLQEVEAFPSTEDADDLYLTKSTRLQLDVAKGMFAELRWQLDFDNTPSPGTDRLDNRYMLSVGWTF